MKVWVLSYKPRHYSEYVQKLFREDNPPSIERIEQTLKFWGNLGHIYEPDIPDILELMKYSTSHIGNHYSVELTLEEVE